ncbi:MAG: tRNA (adenosine(37)-N6)-threonylcarbamoyltransferase complex dimerization subunit type 1 TsaB [Planctomycetota bacterium]|jgi:tRNA threonylcarbamoyl adenosine modification protein YeaZ
MAIDSERASATPDLEQAPLLALETSTRALTVALGRPGEPFEERVVDSERAHASALAPAARELLSDRALELRDLGGIVVGIGPGSFTGLRVAAAFALGLERSTGRPTFGLSSMATDLTDASSSGTPALVLSDARGRRVYAGAYLPGTPPTELVAPCAPRLDEFTSWLEQCGLKGDFQVRADERTLGLRCGTVDLQSVIAERLGRDVAPDPVRPSAAGLLRCLSDSQPALAPGSLRPLYLSRFGE